MSGPRLPKWAQLTSLGVVFSIIIAVIVLNVKQDDPCSTMTRHELIAFYPELDELARKHQLETDKLLTLHRTQDVLINLKMSSEQVDPEQALQISMRQVNELAAMRRAQMAEFDALCHKLVKGRL